MAAAKKELIEVAGREVAISNPEKRYFPEAGITKLDLVRYYLAVGEGAFPCATASIAARREAPVTGFGSEGRLSSNWPR